MDFIRQLIQDQGDLYAVALRSKAAHMRLVLRLAARDGWACKLCGMPPLKMDGSDITIDHITSKNDGGEGSFDALQLAHRTCNTRKSALTRETKRTTCSRCGVPRDTLRGKLCTQCRTNSRNNRGKLQTAETLLLERIVREATYVAPVAAISDLCEAGMHELCVMPACACTCHVATGGSNA